MSLLTGPMLGAIQQRVDTVWLLELGLPGGTRRYSLDGANSASLGHYDGRLLSLGEIHRATDRDYRLAAMEVQAEIDDTDMALGKLAEGSTGHQIPGSTAVIKLAAGGVATANWHTEATLLVDKLDFSQKRICTVTMRSDDLALNRAFPRDSILTDFPRADKTVTGDYATLIYGKYDSGGAGGAVPLPLVDPTKNWYLVQRGRAKAVDRVCVGGIVASGWTATNVTVNGRWYTVVAFTVGQGTAAVTADVQGIDNTGDGTGALMENPATQLQHLLGNFVYGDWQSGSLLALTTARLHQAYVDATSTYFTNHGTKGSHRYAGAQRTGLAALEEWCASWRVRPFWTCSGLIGLRFQNPGDTTAPVAWLRPENHELDPITLPYDTQNVLDRVSVRYHPDAVLDDLTQTLEIRDPSARLAGSMSLDLPWSYAGV